MDGDVANLICDEIGEVVSYLISKSNLHTCIIARLSKLRNHVTSETNLAYTTKRLKI